MKRQGFARPWPVPKRVLLRRDAQRIERRSLGGDGLNRGCGRPRVQEGERPPRALCHRRRVLCRPGAHPGSGLLTLGQPIQLAYLPETSPASTGIP